MYTTTSETWLRRNIRASARRYGHTTLSMTDSGGRYPATRPRTGSSSRRACRATTQRDMTKAIPMRGTASPTGINIPTAKITVGSKRSCTPSTARTNSPALSLMQTSGESVSGSMPESARAECRIPIRRQATMQIA